MRGTSAVDCGSATTVKRMHERVRVSNKISTVRCEPDGCRKMPHKWHLAGSVS